MTERSAEQTPVQDRPDTQDNTARIPLAERLQRRVGGSAGNGQAPRESSRVLPPPPPELVEQQAREEEARRQAEAATVAPAPVAREESSPAAVPLSPVAAPARRSTEQRQPARAPRRARLRLSRIDPWSVMKVSFLLSIAFGIVTVVSVFMVWSVLGAAGVWSSINNTVSDTVSSGNQTSTFDITNYLGMSRVLGFTMLVAVIDVVLITAIATLGAFLYNMAASLLGGIEVTLAEDQP
jgi:hypothetical protein